MQLFTLTISHRHGTDTYVFDSRDGAREALATYCRAWWDYEMDGEPMPASDDSVIESYFEKMGDHRESEYYSLDECRLNDGPHSFAQAA